jgi:hypothetical protein
LGSSGNITLPSSYSTDRWYHLALTFGGETYKLYIDGIEVAKKTGQAL